ncbi:hypothetical protein E2C01_000784 [Portunus trituberculatus]|uniref:Uncharacterized protein n=1 Tax=Portunus trituberculatus TaxID=210409 RepID=A0A5B7CFK3_PORTR|nr:hypothetical protein [Portunus trituberculatus]
MQQLSFSVLCASGRWASPDPSVKGTIVHVQPRKHKRTSIQQQHKRHTSVTFVESSAWQSVG